MRLSRSPEVSVEISTRVGFSTLLQQDGASISGRMRSAMVSLRTVGSIGISQAALLVS